MIDKIILKSGSAPAQPNLEVELSPITVFVGPNNSGKSLILKEIEFALRSPLSAERKILSNLSFTNLTKEEIEEEILKIQIINDRNIGNGQISMSKISGSNSIRNSIEVNKHDLIHEAQNPNKARSVYSKFLNLYTFRLDGTNRLNLLKEEDAGDLQAKPQNLLSYLFRDNPIRSKVRTIIFEAFGTYFVIDPTKMGKLRVKFSEKEPLTERVERGWDDESVTFHNKGILVNDMSDGVKAFSGIITTILAGDPKVILIDEPEAFLHPALSNKLAKEIGKSLTNAHKRLFVSTHSSSFLMGCIQSGSPLNIVRLTYKNGAPTSCLLPKDKILHLMRHPLLRSTGVLNGLFYESVIVTEADSDRAFYQEINERLLSENDPRGINNCLFINAQNKQTVWEIVKPLRELGIPAFGIVDIDMLKDGGREFTKLAEGAFVPQINHQPWNTQREAFKNALNATGMNWKTQGGIETLQPTDKEASSNFFNQFDEYGIFVVRGGEVESWLKHLRATGHGSIWLIDMFEKMGENPLDSNYVKPTDNDVWNFIGQVKNWIENPLRKGIPL